MSIMKSTSNDLLSLDQFEVLVLNEQWMDG